MLNTQFAWINSYPPKSVPPKPVVEAPSIVSGETSTSQKPFIPAFSVYLSPLRRDPTQLD